jgi:putative intracellular protease/amidase
MSRIGLGGMSRTLAALALAGASMASVAAPKATSHKVLLMPREGSADIELMVTKELMVMIKMLKEAGYEPVVATEHRESFVSEKGTVKATLALAKVRVPDYAAVVMACMAAGEPGPVPEAAVKIVTDAAAAGKPIAAQAGSLFILSRAGLLKGRKYAYNYEHFSEGTYGGAGVVQDGLIITSGLCPYAARPSGKPDGTAELMQRLIETLKTGTQ